MTDSPQTILDMMVADVYLNKMDETVTILHDQAFEDELLSLEYDTRNGDLLFNFQGGTLPFGVEFFDEFAEFFNKVDIITVIQVETETNTPVLGMEVPIIVK